MRRVQGGCGSFCGTGVSVRGAMNSPWPRKREAEPMAEGEGQRRGRASDPLTSPSAEGRSAQGTTLCPRQTCPIVPQPHGISTQSHTSGNGRQPALRPPGGCVRESIINYPALLPPPPGFQNTEIEIQVLAGERKVESSLEKATRGICPVAFGVGDVSWAQVSGDLCPPQSP